MSRSRLVVLLVVVAALLAHATTLDGAWVYDDHRFIEHNDAIRSVRPLDFLTDATTASHAEGVQADVYRPLRTLVFAIEYAAFGLRPWAWHAVSVLLHALGAVLVFFVLGHLFGRQGVAPLFGALLFAVHPVTTESVAWVSSQGDLLAVVLLLGALLVMRRDGAGRTVVGALLFVLAVLAKESALVLPALVGLYGMALAWRARRAPGGSGLDAPSPATSALRVGVLAVLALAYLVLRAEVIPELRQVPHPYGSVAASARGMAFGLVWYATALVLPTGFAFDEQIRIPLTWWAPEAVLGLSLLLTVVLAGAFALVRRRGVLVFATLGFLACLVPVSNVFVPLKAFVAERFLYPALVAFVAGAALAFHALDRRWPWVARSAAAAVLVVLAVATASRGEAWSDETTLWTAVRADRPWNPRAYEGLGYQELGRLEALMQRAPESRGFGWAEWVEDVRRTAERAEIAYSSYLAANPGDGKAHFQLGNVFGVLARALESMPVEAGEAITPEGPAYARRQQVTQYRRALEVWEALGFERGRGSPRLLDRMLERWAEAAVRIGDLREAKFAVDAMLQRAGVAPGDPEAVWREASWELRRRRLLVALASFLLPEQATEEARRLQAVVLADAGIDPERSEDARLRAARDRVDALVAGAPAGREHAVFDLALHGVDLTMALGDRVDVEDRLLRLQARHGPHPEIAARVRQLEEAR